jgi:diguanylate cyclase (GGDEF)-like protein/PAS domain S-box-containing protein
MPHVRQRQPPSPAVQQALALAPSGAGGPDLAACQRELLELDAELSVIAIRAAERALRVTQARERGSASGPLDRETHVLSAELEEVVRRAADRARRLDGVDGVIVEVVERTGRVHRAQVMEDAAGQRGADGAVPERIWRRPPGSVLAVCADTETDPRVDREGCRRLGARSLITAPLRHRGVPLGAVTLTSSGLGALGEAHSALLRILAGQVTSAAARLGVIAEMYELGEHHLRTIAASEARFRRLFYENPQPMWLLDAETGRFLLVNDAAVAKYGYSAEEFAAMTGTSLRRDAAQYAADFSRALAGSATFTARHRLRDGRLIDVEITSGPQEFDGRRAALSIVNDVTERNRLYRQLREGALHDPLTGGANRTLFTERVAHALARMRRRSATIAVLVADLDQFKHVNDSLGHAAGDALLQAAAGRIQATLRPGDTVARLSADEFALLLEEVGHPDGALEAAERLTAAFADPLEFADESLVMTISIGLATASTTHTSAEELLGNAELAMFEAKAAGRGTVTVFEPRMQATAAERLSLDQDLRRAVERDELRVFYQPQIATESGEIVGCEALVRWQHPLRGLVPPDNFIPLAEETGVISAIDAWVLRTACAQAAAWHRAGHSDLVIAVNVSGRELGRADLVDRIEAALFETGLSPECLEVEITETTAAVQPAEALEELRQLRRAGITVAIDDFGTGYSSLSKLSTFPVDRLKIDRSFLTTIKRESDDEPLVAAMIGMAHRLGLEVTAEGVETAAQLAFLRRNGCDLVQGYLFSRPVPADAFEELLRSAPQRAWTA